MGQAIWSVQMPKATVLFVCSDNSLLSPLAESYLNQAGGGLVRAFSAGINPGAEHHPSLHRVLDRAGLTGRELQPKSLDVFMLPHAPVPDQIVCFSGAVPPQLPGHLRSCADWHEWTISVLPDALLEDVEAVFRDIRYAVDRMLGGLVSRGAGGLKVA